MKIVQVYNRQRSGGGGECIVVKSIKKSLENRGHCVYMIERDSRRIVTLADKMLAFAKGVYSWQAKREVAGVIARECPDVIHVHNLYPLLSPSVLVAGRKMGIPTVMTVHNYVLTCPVLTHLYENCVCAQCLGGREYWCILKNCRGNIFESIAYAVRSAVARRLRFFHDNVTLFIVLSEFAKHRLVEAGFEEKRIVVLPNMVAVGNIKLDPSEGQYIAFAGRMSPEKGINTLLAAAARLPKLRVRLAGDGPIMPALVKHAPTNTTFLGRLESQKMVEFYQNARFVVVPSIWQEPFGLVAIEAMSYGLPVVASKIGGGLSEIVEDSVTGLLFEPGNSEDLASKIKLLWENPELCRQMGQAGQQKVIREYSEEVYYKRLMAVYEKAIEIDKEQQHRGNVNGKDFSYSCGQDFSHSEARYFSHGLGR